MAVILALGWALSASAADVRWTPVGIQQPGESDRTVWSIDSAPGRPTTLLLATFGHGVMRSLDGGSSWTAVIPKVDAWVVRFDADHPDVAYAGTASQGVFKSIDGGATWSAANQGLSALDVRALAVTKDLIVAGTSGGVFYSRDGAASWTSLGLTDLNIAAVAMVAGSSGVMVLAGADSGGSSGGSYLFRTQDVSGSWSTVHLPADAGVVTALSVGAPPAGAQARPVLAGTATGLFRSDDGAATWTQVNGLPETDINVVLFNPSNPDQLYAASDGDVGNGGVFRSLDRGSTWSPLGFGLPANPRVTALALQPLSPLAVFAATWNPTTQQVGLYHIPDPDASSGTAQPSPRPSTAAATSPAPTAAFHSADATPAGAAVPLAARIALAAGAVVLLVVAIAVVLARQLRPS